MSLYGSKAYGIYDFVEIFTDTVDEYSAGNGVLVDFVRFKDGTVRAPGAVGLRADDINEVTPANGIPIDGVALKDAGGTFTGSVNTDTLEELTLNVGVTCNSNLAIVAGKALQTDTIAEVTGGNGVVVDSLRIRDGVAEQAMKGTPYGQLNRSSVPSAVQPDQDIKVNFTNETDPNGWTSTALDRFVAGSTMAGIYLVWMSSGLLDPNVQGACWELKLWKNGSEVDRVKVSYTETTNNLIINMLSIQKIDVGDYLELYLHLSGDGSTGYFVYSASTSSPNQVKMLVYRLISLT